MILCRVRVSSSVLTRSLPLEQGSQTAVLVGGTGPATLTITVTVPVAVPVAVTVPVVVAMVSSRHMM